MSPRTKPGVTRERVYRFVRERLEQGLPPTVREVQEALGFRAVQTAREHLERLVLDGRLSKRAGKARGYFLPEHHAGAAPPMLIPVLGRIQAGDPHSAIEAPEGHIPVQGKASDDLFGLRVQGESMSGAGILPGDVVIVRSQPTAEPGDIVAALVDGEATVKTFRVRRRRVELHPENPDFDPIIPKPGEFSILGKVVEVRRFLEGKGV
jgi:repressor LexA